MGSARLGSSSVGRIGSSLQSGIESLQVHGRLHGIGACGQALRGRLVAPADWRPRAVQADGLRQRAFRRTARTAALPEGAQAGGHLALAAFGDAAVADGRLRSRGAAHVARQLAVQAALAGVLEGRLLVVGGRAEDVAHLQQAAHGPGARARRCGVAADAAARTAGLDGAKAATGGALPGGARAQAGREQRLTAARIAAWPRRDRA